MSMEKQHIIAKVVVKQWCNLWIAMVAKDWVIIWLSLQITGLSIYATKQAYEIGYGRGQIKVLTTFDGTMEGTHYGK